MRVLVTGWRIHGKATAGDVASLSRVGARSPRRRAQDWPTVIGADELADADLDR